MRRCPAFAATVVVSLVPEDDGTAESALRGALALRYNTVKPFLSLLGESRALGAATGGMRILTGGSGSRRCRGGRRARSRCCRGRSTTSWCRGTGARRCTRTPSSRRGGRP